MSTIPERQELATAKYEDAASVVSDIANGGDTTEVQTESGPTPTIKKWMKDRDAQLGSIEVNADRAEQAADVATQSSGIFGTTALGLVGTTSGKYFYVPSPDSSESLVLYKNDAGAAIDTGKRTPSSIAIQDIASNFAHFNERSGFVAGVVDALNRRAVSVRNDGMLLNKDRVLLDEIDAILSKMLKLEAGLPFSWTTRSGSSFGVADMLDQLALSLDMSGSLFNKGRNILAEIDAIKSGATDSKWITPSRDIYTGGDSLSDNSYQVFLRQMLPERNIVVESLPGKKSGQIARLQGGIAPMITIVGSDTVTANTIPSTGSVEVSVDVPFLRNSIQITGHLYGVYGVLSAVNDVHFFTRSQPGSAVEIDTITPFIKSTVDYDYAFRTPIFWVGNNDYESAYRPEVDSNALRMVEYLKPQDKRFIIIGMAIADYPERHKGTPYYTDTMALHKKWRERWPDNFIDITPILQRHYDPNNPTDVQNLIDGCTPSSLRDPGDKIHLNSAGQLIVAETIFSHLTQRGW